MVATAWSEIWDSRAEKRIHIFHRVGFPLHQRVGSREARSRLPRRPIMRELPRIRERVDSGPSYYHLDGESKNAEVMA
jgi:hypothetical protein